MMLGDCPIARPRQEFGHLGAGIRHWRFRVAPGGPIIAFGGRRL
jgi:hypothetical protein